MPAKVTFTVLKGALIGREYSYDGKETLILGRQGDCNIVIPENTISRYHCMIEVSPPDVAVRDFGSLNGTFLNGRKIGQRGKEMSVEEARNEIHSEFTLKEGDTLGLGGDCELKLSIDLPEYCGNCSKELADDDIDAVSSKWGAHYFEGEGGRHVCRSCHEAMEKRFLAEQQARKEAAELKSAEEKRKREQDAAEARRRAEQEAAARRAQSAKCAICGAAFTRGAPDDAICPGCMANPQKLLEFLLLQAMDGTPEAQAIKGYRQIKLLGRGGMGEVWLVQEEKNGQADGAEADATQGGGRPPCQSCFFTRGCQCRAVEP